jgi:hypothetical protein
MTDEVGIVSMDLEEWKKKEKVILKEALKRTGIKRSDHTKVGWNKYFLGFRNWYLYSLAIRPNRFEVLVHEINGAKRWINISGVDAPEDFLYRVYYINPLHEELYNNQISLLNSGHFFNWEDIIKVYKLNKGTRMISLVEQDE